MDEFKHLATHPDLRIRQAVAEQYTAPQRDAGSLIAAFRQAMPNGVWRPTQAEA